MKLPKLSQQKPDKGEEEADVSLKVAAIAAIYAYLERPSIEVAPASLYSAWKRPTAIKSSLERKWLAFQVSKWSLAGREKLMERY